MNNFGGGNHVCATCKWFRPSPQFSECHLEPPRSSPLLLGVGPPTTGNPNGTPVIHIDVRYAIVNPNMDCSHWAVRLERATSIDNLPMLGHAE